jgi:hypothetical protein
MSQIVPYIRGPKPMAIIMLKFTDCPNLPVKPFYDFVATTGTGGLFDYWRDISNKTIDLAGSEVYGPFEMKYSYAKDSLDPYHNPNDKDTPRRKAFMDEARRICAERGIDLSRFAACIAFLNGHADGGAITGDNMCVLSVGNYGQQGWKWCSRCSAMVYTYAGGGSCVGGGLSLHDHTGSGNYNLALNDAAYPGERNFRFCKKCKSLFWAGRNTPQPIAQGACFAGGVHDPEPAGTYTVNTAQTTAVWQGDWAHCNKCQLLVYKLQGRPCPGGGDHSYSSYTFGLDWSFSDLNTVIAPHETGHCLGLEHSWAKGTPDVEYGDPWDIMSASSVHWFNNKIYDYVGPGMNAPKLLQMGWIKPQDVLEASPTRGVGTAKLVALSSLEEKGYRAILWNAKNRVYTIEFRIQAGFDRGIPRSVVLVHEMRSKYLVGQKCFCYCNKCKNMVLAKSAICPGGAIHSTAESGNYRVGTTPVANSQQGWTTCTDCRGLWYRNNQTVGICPAKGSGHTSTGKSLFVPDNSPGGPGQSGWKWCRKCQGMWYGAELERRGKGVCPAGGRHLFDGSGDYTLNNTGSGVGEEHFHFCRKCNGMWDADFGQCTAGGTHTLGSSWDYGLPLDSSEQTGWRSCVRCYCVYYGTGSASRCVYGGAHIADTPVYSVSWDQTSNGQEGWRWCSKCQGLFYAPEIGATKCAAGGQHVQDGSAFYRLPNFLTDLSFLISRQLGAGETWEDREAGIRVEISRFDVATTSAYVSVVRFEGPSVAAPDAAAAAESKTSSVKNGSPADTVSEEAAVEAVLKGPIRPSNLNS